MNRKKKTKTQSQLSKNWPCGGESNKSQERIQKSSNYMNCYICQPNVDIRIKRPRIKLWNNRLSITPNGDKKMSITTWVGYRQVGKWTERLVRRILVGTWISSYWTNLRCATNARHAANPNKMNFCWLTWAVMSSMRLHAGGIISDCFGHKMRHLQSFSSTCYSWSAKVEQNWASCWSFHHREMLILLANISYIIKI